MKPLHLSIKGLFSYRQKAEIDFIPLTEAGLFGIFGPVGSGKSTILDAMTLALYGESDRLSTQDRRNYNLMNLQSRELKIRFRFIHDGRDYLFTVDGNRHTKRYDEVKTFKRRAYRIKNGETIALNDDNRAFSAQEILGISYDNFRRTIIIPQGRFQEFLQLTANNRRTMMKELFGLEKYDLKNPTSALLQTAKERRSGVEGSLEALNHASEKELQHIRQELSSADERAAALLEKSSAARNRLQQLDHTAELFQRLESAQEEIRNLEARRKSIEQQREQLNRYEECGRRFSTRLQHLDEQILTYRKLRESVKTAEDRKRKLQQTQMELEQRFATVQASYEQKDSLDEQALQFEALSRLKKLLDQSETLAARQRKLDEQRNELDASIEKLQNERSGLKRRIEKLQAETALFDDLHEISEWYSERKSLLQKRQDIKERIEQTRREAEQHTPTLEMAAAELQEKIGVFAEKESAIAGRLSDLSTELAALHRELTEALRATAVETAAADPTQLEQLFDAVELRVQKTLQKLRKSLLSEDSRQGIYLLSRQLETDAPCPVCGSRQHPAPAHQRAEVKTAETAQEDMLEVLDELRNRLIQHKTACKSALALINSRFQDIAQLQSSLSKLDQKTAAHMEEFRWSDYSPEDETAFKAAHSTAQNARSEAAQAQRELQQLEAQIDQLTKKLAAHQAEQQNLKEKLAVLEHREADEATKVNGTIRREYEACGNEELSDKAEALRAEVQQVEEEYRSLQSRLHKDELALRDAEATERERRSNREAAVEQIEQSAVQTAQALAESENASIHTVRQILAAPLDVQAVRAEIEAFYQKYSAANEKLDELKDSTAGIEYSGDEHQAARENAEQLDGEYANLLSKKGGLQNQLEAVKKDLARKQTLQQEKQQLDTRIDYLNELFRLFKGQGFVNFVATRYLHDLCARANERFFRLTRKQLRLEISAGNEFVIRDYLNGGRVRSVKTLSGGQLFQASFSLALALADSIHQNKESFFFLDEGFGSLDRRSLQEVFDTLKSLRKEHRIVGVISHVEELREEIPVALQVSEDPEAGSRIVSSM